MKLNSSVYSRQFNRRVANIGESDEEYSSKCSEEMKDQIYKFPNSVFDNSKNDVIAEFDFEGSKDSAGLPNI